MNASARLPVSTQGGTDVRSTPAVARCGSRTICGHARACVCVRCVFSHQKLQTTRVKVNNAAVFDT